MGFLFWDNYYLFFCDKIMKIYEYLMENRQNFLKNIPSL